TMSDAATQNSNPTPGAARFVFDSRVPQRLSFTNVQYAGGRVHFEGAGSRTRGVADGFELNGAFVTRGTVTALGALTVLDGAVYGHAQDGGDLPEADWAPGSTFLLTGTVQDAPGNRNQDFHHVVFDTP